MRLLSAWHRVTSIPSPVGRHEEEGRARHPPKHGEGGGIGGTSGRKRNGEYDDDDVNDIDDDDLSWSCSLSKPCGDDPASSSSAAAAARENGSSSASPDDDGGTNATGTTTDGGRNGGYDVDVDEEYVVGVLSRRNATFSELASVGPSTYARTIPSLGLVPTGIELCVWQKKGKKEWSTFGG